MLAGPFSTFYINIPESFNVRVASFTFEFQTLNGEEVNL